MKCRTHTSHAERPPDWLPSCGGHSSKDTRRSQCGSCAPADPPSPGTGATAPGPPRPSRNPASFAASVKPRLQPPGKPRPSPQRRERHAPFTRHVPGRLLCAAHCVTCFNVASATLRSGQAGETGPALLGPRPTFPGGCLWVYVCVSRLGCVSVCVSVHVLGCGHVSCV